MAKRILVPLDQSSDAEAVIDLIADLARGGGATVRLLHVAPLPGNVVTDEGHVVAYADQEAARLEAEALDYLSVMEVKLGGVPTECVVRFGDPAREILLEADAFGADLVALTMRGVKRFGRVVRGGVTGQIARKATPPVLMLRPGLALAA